MFVGLGQDDFVSYKMSSILERICMYSTTNVLCTVQYSTTLGKAHSRVTVKGFVIYRMGLKGLDLNRKERMGKESSPTPDSPILFSNKLAWVHLPYSLRYRLCH